MKVLLISANTEKINMPTLPLGLASVAAATKKAGHEVAQLDLMFEEDTRLVVKEAIEGFNPDVIGISVRNIDDQNMENPRFLLKPVRGIIADCRSLSGAPVVLGGAGYSIFPESALSYLGADMGIQGEGEVAFPALLERLEQHGELSGLPGLYLSGRASQDKRNFTKNLDDLSFPDNYLWSPSDFHNQELWIPIQSRRGCPLHCSYCSTATIEGGAIRRRSPEFVVQEIARLVDAGYNYFYFVDNTFNFPRSYAMEICRLILTVRLNITWRCILYPLHVDRELVESMAKAGCREVSLGFESGSERILSLMNKKFKPEDVRQISGMLAEQGIRQMGFLLLGGPGETKETIEESLNFADSLKLDLLKITMGICIYPYTSVAKISMDEGFISCHDDLLLPRFYLARGLEDWLPETLKDWMAARPHRMSQV